MLFPYLSYRDRYFENPKAFETSWGQIVFDQFLLSYKIYKLNWFKHKEFKPVT